MTAPPLRKTITKLDLLSLRLFLTICEEGSLGRAAERESIAPSAVTKRIQELEYLFNVKLLYRNARGTVPTPVGEALAEHARSIFRIVEEIRTDLGEFSEGIKGHVRVVAIPSALAGFAAADLREFIELHPQVHLDIKECIGPDVQHAIATGTADIGICAASASNEQDVGDFPYRQDELVLLAPLTSPFSQNRSISFVEVLDFDFIGVQENSALMKQLRKAAASLGRRFTPQYVVQSNEVARSMVASGFGLAVLPVSSTALCSDQCVAIRLSDNWARRELRLLAKNDGALPAQTRLLLDFLGKHADRRETRTLELATDHGVRVGAALSG